MGVTEQLKTNGIEFKENEPMCNHTTFKIGGPCDIFIEPKNTEELKFAIETVKNDMPFKIIGNGSNLLVADLGIEGAVIKIGQKMSEVHTKEQKIYAASGARLSSVCAEALEEGLGGMQYLWGIPGTIGGAVYMNAGAYGGEIASVITSATYLTDDGKTVNISKEEMDFSYRHSIFKENGGIILSAEFTLQPQDKTQLRLEMDELILRRKTKQPLEYPSAGSVFKRPEGHFAGELIEKCGLKGYSIGGAMVSEKHAGFIINTGDATASDVRRLIEYIKEKVFLTESVKLESEIIFMGR
mgnify:CR=1 FL=1